MKIYELYNIFKINYMDKRLKPTTVRGYVHNYEKYIYPVVGELQLSQVTYDKVDELVGFCQGFGINNTSVVYVLATLSKMLSFAVKRGFIGYNVLRSYDYPKLHKYHYRTIDKAQMSQLLQVSFGSDCFPAFLLACHYGLRRGECAAVKLSDFNNSILSVNSSRCIIDRKVVETSPKNDRVRSILISHHDLFLLVEWNKNRDPNCEGLLLRRRTGAPISPNVLDKELKKYLQMLQFPSLRFHDLRHSYATLMFFEGVNPKIVSEVLGHSSVDITLDLYSHANVSIQKACLTVFDKP